MPKKGGRDHLVSLLGEKAVGPGRGEGQTKGPLAEESLKKGFEIGESSAYKQASPLGWAVGGLSVVQRQKVG